MVGSTAWAADYGITVAGVPVTSDNATAIKGTGISGSVSYNAATRTLTLSDATVNASSGYAIEAKAAVTLVLKGTNKLSAKDVSLMLSGGDVVIKGSGSLDCKGSIKMNAKKKTLHITGGCHVTVEGVIEGSETETLKLSDRATKLTVDATRLESAKKTSAVFNFADLDMNDGLRFSEEFSARYSSLTSFKVMYFVNMDDEKSFSEPLRIVKIGHSYGFSIAGIPVTYENASNITGNGVREGKVSYDPQTGTLTLINATIGTYSLKLGDDVNRPYSIYGNIPLKIKLGGTNNLLSSLYIHNDLEIIGSGFLACKDLFVKGNKLTFSEGCNVRATYITGGELVVRGEDTKITATRTITFPKHEFFDGLGVSQPVFGEYYISPSWVVDYYDGMTISHFYGLSIAGIPVTKENAADFKGDGISGEVTYDPATHTLKLKDAKISYHDLKYGESGLVSRNDTPLNIQLEGKNSLHLPVECDDDLNVTGSGILSTFGVLSANNFNVSGGFTWYHHAGAFKIPENVKFTISGDDTFLWWHGYLSNECFSAFTLNDGLRIVKPKGAHYDAQAKTILDRNGNKVEGELFIGKPGILVAGFPVTHAGAKTLAHEAWRIDGGVDYDPASRMLTLENATLTCEKDPAIDTEGHDGTSLIINLKGNNTIKMGNKTPTMMNLYSETAFTGKGKLTTAGQLIGDDDKPNNVITVKNGKSLQIVEGCNMKVGSIIGEGGGLTVGSPATRVAVTDYVRGFNSLLLRDGLALQGDGKLSYGTQNHYVADAATGAEAHGFQIAAADSETPQTSEYGLSVAGVAVNSQNAKAIKGEGISGTVSFDPETKTLTLDNATINTGEYIAIDKRAAS